MGKNKNIKGDLSQKLAEGFLEVRKKLIEEQKRHNGYLVIADKDGKVIKIPAKDL